MYRIYIVIDCYIQIKLYRCLKTVFLLKPVHLKLNIQLQMCTIQTVLSICRMLTQTDWKLIRYPTTLVKHYKKIHIKIWFAFVYLISYDNHWFKFWTDEYIKSFRHFLASAKKRMFINNWSHQSLVSLKKIFFSKAITSLSCL